MKVDLGTSQRGCLLLADITGYTKYMSESEITHAQDVIGDLIETIVDVITPTFEVSKIEGDAAFAYAGAGSMAPSVLLETVNSAYFTFRRRIRDIAHATSCSCRACIRIPTLDLKLFLHEGEYAVRRMAGFTELSGMDIIVLHRLAKGTAASVVDGHGYAVYTAAIVEAMGVDATAIGLIPHTEEFDDTGSIEVFVLDLEERWASELESAVLQVSAQDAIHQASFETEAEPRVLWDHLTDPVKRLQWQLHVTEVLPMTKGRPQTGSVNHCMHGADVTIEHIADWRPYSHLTLRYDVAGIKDWLWTYRLDPTDIGTRLTALLSDPGNKHWERVGTDFAQTVDEMIARLGRLVGKSGT
jgi:hypothetical protein